MLSINNVVSTQKHTQMENFNTNGSYKLDETLETLNELNKNFKTSFLVALYNKGLLTDNFRIKNIISNALVMEVLPTITTVLNIKKFKSQTALVISQ